jgi:multicomponent Na+:H+ antiporter subunit C
VTGHWVYWCCIVLMMVGLYTVVSRENLVKKIMGLNLLQVSVILFYVAVGKVKGGTAPILNEGAEPFRCMTAAGEVVSPCFSNPLPHVLMLTAIVVGVATTALGLALAVRIGEAYGTVEEDDIVRLDQKDESSSPLGAGL